MNITFDSTTRTVSINKATYSFEFFEMLGTPGGIRLGTPFKITKREKGTITIQILDPEDIEEIYKAQQKRGKK